ncbi:MAG TPA: VWA domain-containing protein [Thermoanaerobaculia bacterium]|nr:VWA domain-containing protein [Thermoanaerobaculia bacterium]
MSAVSTRSLLAISAAAVLVAGCDDVRLGRPDALWLLWVVPLLVLFLVWGARRRALLLRQFATPALLERIVLGSSRGRRAFKSVLLVIGVTSAVLALAGFAYGFTWEDVSRRGVDIAVALDVSDSMLVKDADPASGLSRLERARREIADLLDVMRGDRLALVAFAGLAYVELPLTLDYQAARLFLDVLDTDLIPVPGTALDAAIDTAIEALEEGGGKGEKALILITDGEDHSGKALEAAARAKARGIRIFSIGIGREEGSPIPRESGGFRRDESGEIILSRLDEPTLQRLALETGGRYVRSVTGDLDLEQVYFQGIKASIAEQELGATRRQRWKDRFQWLLALALVALMVEPLVAESARGHKLVTRESHVGTTS